MGLGSSCTRVKNKQNRTTTRHDVKYNQINTKHSSLLSPSLPLLSSSRQATTNHHPHRQLTILHFNDVYNIEEREVEPVGGAARFKTAFEQISDKIKPSKPLVLFSGDALAPSNMSVITFGQQMVPVLNSLNVNAAVYGNHDFDFGVDHLIKIAGETNFPWLMTNVKCKHTKCHLAQGLPYHIIEWNNIKIGLLGLVEREWLDTVATISTEDDVLYTDYVESAKHYIPILTEMGCELLIALTHMRQPNDRRLLQEVPQLDLILGGHDHHYEKEELNGRILLKSGSDFREFSELTVTLRERGEERREEREGEEREIERGEERNSVHISVKKHIVTKEYPQNDNVRNIVETYQQQLNEGLDQVIVTLATPLDGRFKSVRTSETNLGNLIADIMRLATKSDVALINSGTLRSDRIHETGPFKMKDLMSILPMIDSLVVLTIKGHQIRTALENGVSQYPKLEGRFPQVSGLRFSFNPQTTPRIRSVTIRGENLILDKEYTLCTKSYIANGKDGYTVFKNLPKVIDEEEGPILKPIVRKYLLIKGQEETDGGEEELMSISTCSMFDSITPGQINSQVDGRIAITNN